QLLYPLQLFLTTLEVVAGEGWHVAQGRRRCEWPMVYWFSTHSTGYRTPESATPIFSGAHSCTDASAGLAVEPQEANGVLLQDQRPHLVLDRQLLEVGEPAVRCQQRVVGAEHDLLLEQGVGARPRVWG